MEYVWQRFWADADVGTTFWHDHAFGGTTWPHGAVGTIIIEPFGSTWHNAKTGERIRTGPIADINLETASGRETIVVQVANSGEIYLGDFETVRLTVNLKQIFLRYMYTLG